MTVRTNPHEDLGWLYHNATRNIEFAKQQQWRVTYYVLLLYAALVVFAQLWSPGPLLPTIFTALAFFVLLMGVYILYDYNNWLKEQRDILDCTIKLHFSKEFNEIRNNFSAREGWWRDWDFFILFSGTLATAFVVVLWWLWSVVRSPNATPVNVC